MDSCDRRVEATAAWLASPLRLVFLSLVTLALACGFSSRDGSDDSERSARTSQALGSDPAAADVWTGTWAASPQVGNAIFSRQTLRQIVRTSIAGSVARIQLSNVFGTQPLVVSDVHIAQRASGSSIAAGTDRSVTFGGQVSTIIAAGALGVSDPIEFAVAALSDVAVSFYLPQPTGPITTSHATALQTNYVADGDVSGDATFPGLQTNTYYFLANLDVQNPSSEGAVVTLGASITDGVASAPNANRRWPNDLAARLARAGRTIGVLNEGISGNELLTDGAGQAALHRFQRDVLSQPGVKWVICCDDPIDDLGSSNPPSSDRLIAGLAQIVSTAHQSGVKFFCSTLTPFQGAGGWTPRAEVGRAAFNAFVRSAASGCDGVVDQDVATHDPANPIRYLPAYDSGARLHPNAAGLQAIANAVSLSLFGAAAGNPGDGGSSDAGAIDDGGSSSDDASSSSAPTASSSGGDGGGTSSESGTISGDAGSGDASSGVPSSGGSSPGPGARDSGAAGGGSPSASGCACAAGSEGRATPWLAAFAFTFSLVLARRRVSGDRALDPSGAASVCLRERPRTDRPSSRRDRAPSVS